MTDVPAPSTFVTATTEEIRAAWLDGWGGFIVSGSRVYHPADVEGLTMRATGQVAALVTWAIFGNEAEIVSLDAFIAGQGYGRRLLAEAVERIGARGVRRAWLITTNDNVGAIGVYLREGWRLVAIHLDALDRVRQLKPQVPLVGENGLPLRDEWEFEKRISASAEG